MELDNVYDLIEAKEEIERLNNRVKQLEKSIMISDKKHSFMTKDNIKLRTIINELEKENRELKKEIERLNKQIEEYQKALDETTSEKINLESIIKEVRKYIKQTGQYLEDIKRFKVDVLEPNYLDILEILDKGD